jgi:Fe-S-cluster-containing hydrogenase component 2
MSQVRVDEDKCTGCRSCELGCSFHLKRHYCPDDSAIRVWAEDTEGQVEANWSASKCDLCVNEAQGPQCIYYCKMNAVEVV